MKIKFLKISLLLISCGMLAMACEPKGGNSADSAAPAAATAVPGTPSADLRIATVNMDSINDGFQMVADVQRELASTEEKLANDIQNQGNRWQRDYDNYLQVGATMTLTEQHRQEEDLAKRQQDIATLQQTYANQLTSLQAQRLQEVSAYILDYIEEYNRESGHFSLIITSGTMSGVLYAVPSMDITGVILDGLNQKYAAEKAEK